VLFIAVMLAIILDIDSSHCGFIQVSDDSLLRLQQMIGQDALIAAPDVAANTIPVPDPQAG
jgi:hypothetical protein